MTGRALLRHELQAVFSNQAILLTVFGGVLLYFFLYPLPYAGQVAREQAVVVVNLDDSQLSRRLERMIDATPQVRLSHRAGSQKEAEQVFLAEKLAGILIIPENFYGDLLLGRRPTLSFAGDAGFFLIYGTVLEGMAAAGNTLAAEAKVSALILSGRPQAMAAEQYSAIRLNLVPVFNPTMGYVNYVIPAVFLLILHQTLVMGVGIIGAGQNEPQPPGQEGYWRRAAPLSLLLVRTAIFVGVYWLLTLFYFGFGFSFYAIPHLANCTDLHILLLPFLLSATLLGVCLGAILPRRELATLVVLLSSIPIIFVSGFIWPISAIPAPLVAMGQLVPVVPAIQAFLAVNQMGADFADILPLWNQLWLCAGLYGLVAFSLLRRRCSRTVRQATSP